MSPHKSLNALRTVAAVLVVIYHLRTLLFEDGHKGSILYAVTGLGPAAVLVFFVLSGYWVGGSVLSGFGKQRFRWATYATARLSRLWIVLVPAIALTAVLDHLGLALLPDTSIYLGSEAYHDTVPAGDLAGRLDLGTALGNMGFLQTIVVHTYGTNASLWSLAYEAAFYAIFPLALYAWKGRGGPGLRILNGALAVGVCVLVGPKVLMYLPVWLMGAAVAMFRTRIGTWLAARTRRTLALARGAALILLAGAMAATYASYSGRNVLVLAGATTIMLILLVQDVQWSGWPDRVLTAISGYADSSYSLYAIHLPIAAMTAALLTPDVTRRWAPTLPHWLSLIGLTALLVLIGWAFAWATERHTDRLRKGADRFLRSGAHRALSAPR
ncbi:acyltransferase family protein [Actinoplanes sp. NPDC051494]|uniref:acyltransferase family protein n=1 Tax=Actinoplanes sp. NPDC051494 TaxID=3363907 RepID=UPI0037A5FF0C